MNGNSKIQNNVTSHVLHIWAFALCFLRFFENRKEIPNLSQIFLKMFRPRYVDALGRKNRPCGVSSPQGNEKTNNSSLFDWRGSDSDLHSSSCNSVYCIIRQHKTFSTCEAFSQGGRGYPSKLSDDVLESIELFRLAKPRIYWWENRERLLSNRSCNRRSTGVQSVIWEFVWSWNSIENNRQVSVENT